MLSDNLSLRKENHSSILKLNIEDALTNLKKHVKSILSTELLSFQNHQIVIEIKKITLPDHMDILDEQPYLFLNINYQRTVVNIQDDSVLKCKVLNVFPTHIQAQWMNSINITVFLNDVDSKYVDSQWKIKKSNVIIEEGMDIYIRVKSIEDNEIKGKLDKESMRNQMTPDEHYETIHEYIERKVTKHQK